MTERARTDQEAVALAVEAADRLLDDGEDVYEPEDGVTARAAVLRLGERFARLPSIISEALDGARSSGELLSSDRLQGLAEILQNADDANASEVRLVLREEKRRIVAQTLGHRVSVTGSFDVEALSRLVQGLAR